MLPLDLLLLHRIEQIALAAGELIMQVYRQDFSVDFKADQSPLTEADTQASALILAQLNMIAPDVSILSEESSEYIDLNSSHWQYFLVDPLDGTKEFIKKNGEFTVNIALIQDGVSVLGVVYAPVTGELYSALQHHGAFKVMHNHRVAITVKSAQKPVRIMVSRSHMDDLTKKFLQQYELASTIPMGSSLKICKIAEGGADIYPRFGPTSLWDTAAAQAVLEQAGGLLLDLSGHPLRYADTSKILNPSFIASCARDCYHLV